MKLGGLVVLGVLALGMVIWLRTVFVPLAIAFLIAYVFEPVLKWLDRHHSKRWITVSVFYFLLAALLVGGTALFGPSLFAQGRDLVEFAREKGAEYGITGGSLFNQEQQEDKGDAAEEQEDETGDLFGFLNDFSPVQDGDVGPKSDSTDAASSENDDESTDGDIRQFIRENTRAIARNAPAAISRAGKLLLAAGQSALGGVIQAGLVLFYTFFFMLHFPDMMRAGERWIPEAHEEKVRTIFAEIDAAVAGFFRARLLVCLVAAVVTAVGLLISGLDYWLLLGIAGGFLGIIPVVGVAAVMVVALIIALVSEHTLLQTVGVLITFAVVQSVVEPLVGSVAISQEVDFHPVTVIVSFLAGGVLFGPLGMVLAVPVVAILRILARHFVLPYLRALVHAPAGAAASAEGTVDRPAADDA